MAITIDVGYPKDVHGPDKAPIGQRLARIALAQAYGRGGEFSGPLFQSAKTDGACMMVQFAHVGGGLVASDGGPLKCFEISGEDKKFIPADAKIEGDAVVVSNPQVSKPAAVRYAWLNVPVGCNLFNKGGLPAAPFRTDDPENKH